MRKKFFILSLIFLGLAFFSFSKAQEQKVDYKGEIIIDSDLDGLTDQGEIQIFKTDPQNPDSDGDGFLDGAEVLNKSNPLDGTFPRAKEVIEKTYTSERGETPWAWYLTRSSALLGFFLLWLSLFLGLSIRVPFLNKIVKPIYSFRVHCWISLQATIFALFHGLILLWDKFMLFRMRNVFVPFYPIAEGQMKGIDQKTLALGILSFYIMLILILTSYLRKYINNFVWRLLHFLNIGLFFAVVIHALYLGTDLKNETFRAIFIIANFFILILFAINLLLRIRSSIFAKKDNSNPENNENLSTHQLKIDTKKYEL